MTRTRRSIAMTLLIGLLIAVAPLFAGQSMAAPQVGSVSPASVNAVSAPQLAVAPRRARTANARSVISEAVRERRTRPMRLVFVGSSTTAGVGASTPTRGYVDQVLDRLQLAFPTKGQRGTALSLGTGKAANPGIQAYNGGRGGRTSADYVDVYLLQAIATVQPTCVFHMVGSNDSVTGISPSTYEANVRRSIRRIDELVQRPVCHVLVLSFRRASVSGATWVQYGEALGRIAEDNPRAVLVNAARTFDGLDARGSDPFDLIGPDTVHPTDAGHALLAREASAAVIRKVAFPRRAR